jgi:hypothetical protein
MNAPAEMDRDEAWTFVTPVSMTLQARPVDEVDAPGTAWVTPMDMIAPVPVETPVVCTTVFAAEHRTILY